MSKGIGKIQKRILLLLMGGLALGFSGSPSHSFKILRILKREWRKTSRRNLQRSIKSLCNLGLVKEKINRDGTMSLYLTKEGKEKALTLKLEKIKIKDSKRWDGKWRIVIFDIPENIKKKREIIRYLLKRIGFRELQKSVFIYPFNCEKEINYVVKNFHLKKYVRFIVAERIDNEEKIRRKFNLR